MAELQAKVCGERETVSKLMSQLDDFIQTKEETEQEMLRQFMELLNEKKRKIRDQGRLLAGANVDKRAGWSGIFLLLTSDAAMVASAVKSATEEIRPRRANASRASKRKATKAAEPEQLSEADQMEIDQANAEEQAEDSGLGAATPDRTSDDETEDEHVLAPAAPAPSAPRTRGESSISARSRSRDAVEEEEASPPPRRELPFGRPPTRSKTGETKHAPPADDDETEDEEL